ncbi:MAG TPA: hypothetical protein VIS48_10635 [Candidatus Kryptonia bacterium]
MLIHTRHVKISIVVIAMTHAAFAQTEQLHGEASAWLTTNSQERAVSVLGLRYIPDLLAEYRLGGEVDANMELSLNTFATAQYEQNQSPLYDITLKLYRAWFRLSTERFEARIGLQKINFGSALLFRPLMWFDRVDPRDPLQLSDGVYGILARYTFQDNANFWLWGLYGNNYTKGWEISPTEKETVEYGGRAQSTLWDGEVGITYHHRRADLGLLLPFALQPMNTNVPEDRLGLDGKWDIGIGVWFEAVLIREETDIPDLHFQRQWTLGADYTIAVGNGLYVAMEYFRMENPPAALASANGQGFSGLSMSYPLGILDQLSAIVYRDWNNKQWYRIATWQRKYDNWSLYLLGFWNPETIQIYRNQGGTNAFAGTGFQVMAVFNH